MTETTTRLRRIAAALSRLAVLVGAGTVVVGLAIAAMLTVVLAFLG